MPVRMVGAFFLGVAVALLAVAGSHGQNTPPPSRITPRFRHYLQPAISGDTVVWFDGRRGSPLGRIPGIDIYGRSLRTGREFRVTSSPTADYASSLMVSGQTVVWDDCATAGRSMDYPDMPATRSSCGILRPVASFHFRCACTSSSDRGSYRVSPYGDGNPLMDRSSSMPRIP